MWDKSHRQINPSFQKRPALYTIIKVTYKTTMQVYIKEWTQTV